MAKTYLSTVKYIVRTDFTIDGIVDKHDIIGAIFGQSEGLIGEEMDLKELQKNGKLGRIEVETQTKSGKTIGTLMIPSSLDRIQTSILAAAIESVDKVGPCTSSFITEKIEDARREKRKTVTERAKELLKQMSIGMPETQELTEEIREKTRTADLKEIGRDRIPIGPEVDSSNDIILVEGRADVINLLKHGIKNVAGVGGAKVPRTIINLVKGKKVTLFVDGDRGGDIIARQLGQAMKVSFVAKAPDGKEVEELTLKEILAALRKKEEPGPYSGPRFSDERRKPEFGEKRQFFQDGRRRPRAQDSRRTSRFSDDRKRPSFSEDRGKPEFGERRPSRESSGRNNYRDRPERGSFRSRENPGERSFGRPSSFQRREPSRFAEPSPMKPNDLGDFSNPMKELESSLKARFLDKKLKTVKEVDVRDLLKEMEKHKNIETIVLDGIITKRLLQEAEKNKVKHLVGVKKGRIEESKEVKVTALY